LNICLTAPVDCFDEFELLKTKQGGVISYANVVAIVLIIVAIAASLAVGVYLGIQRRKQVAEKAIG